MNEETLLLTAEMIARRRAQEVKEACNRLEQQGFFNKKRPRNLFRITAPCEVCGTFKDFLYHEVVKICDDCRHNPPEADPILEQMLEVIIRNKNVT